jgi:hypothetical protein
MANLALQTEQEVQTNQDQLCKLYSFKEEKARYRKSYIDWDKIKRANLGNFSREKAKHLSDAAKAILAPVIQKLEKGKRVFLNHKYISTLTFCKRGQNCNIIKQLESVLDITYRNSITVDGKTYRHSYEFAYYKQVIVPQEDNSTAQFIKRSDSLNPSYQGSFNCSIIENKDIEDIDLKSKFLQNSESIKLEENAEPQIREFSPTTPPKLKKRATNQRKKPTMAQAKARIYRFNQYKEPQDLKHHYPLTKEDGAKLQSLSGRDFTLNAMNEILLDMSKRLDNRFCSKAQFIAYFGKCLRFERRDAVKTGNDNFRIKANIAVSNNISCQQEQQKMTKSLQSLPEGIWGDICWKLIDVYGQYVYKNWFSKLTPVIDEQNRTIELKAHNSFIQRWIEDNYRNVIEKTAISMGLRFKEITF